MEIKRYELLDGIRGVTLISMIFYHAVWDIVYIFGVDWDWYRSEAAYVWQQSICWGFILLSGFCWSLGRRKLRRAFTVLLAGLVVSVVSVIFMPGREIMFGVLTLLGSCMLLMIPLDKLFRKVPPVWGMVLSFVLFILFKGVNHGTIGIGTWELAELPRSLYANAFTTYLGFMAPGFVSVDYFSLLPWCFLFFTGYFLYSMAESREGLAGWKDYKGMALGWLGKRSLLVYLLHQPVIYGLLFMFFKVFE